MRHIVTAVGIVMLTVGCNLIPELEIDTEILGGWLFPGDTCSDVDTPWEACINGYVCSSSTGTCEPMGSAGTIPKGIVCVSSGDCAYGLVCDHDGICQETGLPGTVGKDEPCQADEDCQAYLTCAEDGVCEGTQPVLWPGAECANPPTEGEEDIKVYFEVPGAGDEAEFQEFYRLPFPNDIRRSAQGGIDVSGHPNPGEMIAEIGNPVDDFYRMVEDDLDGFGLQSAVFLRFNFYPKSETLVLNENIYLLNIDQDTKGYGKTHAVAFRARSSRGRYICYNWLAVSPGAGAPLPPGTTYAVILTNGITDDSGRPLVQDDHFKAMLEPSAPKGDSALAKAWEVYAPLRAYLDDGVVERKITYDNIAVAAVFTTGDHSKKVRYIRDAVRSSVAPGLGVLQQDVSDSLYSLYQGTMTVPFYQVGTRPFAKKEDGGRIEWSGNAPIEVEQELVKYALSMPNSPQPTGGYPVFIYAHGTGGSELSFVENAFASRMAVMGIAVLSMEQVQHGDRRRLSPEQEGETDFSPERLYYNIFNPRAARDNNLQAAAELFQAVRAIEGMGANAQIQGVLDPERIYFFGHSQGTQGSFIGATYEPAIKGFVLSGAGGMIIESLLGKTQPIDVSSLISLALMDPDVNRYHPVLNIVQAAFDSVDPAVYAPMMFWMDMSEIGIPRRSVFMSSGVEDSYSPENTHMVLANAGHLQQWVTSGQPLGGVAQLTGGLPHSVTHPFIPNTTGVMVRYFPSVGSDGHFVMFDNPSAVTQTDDFIQSMVTPNSIATLSPAK